jgi:enediyne biosynthesis protein E4
MDLVLGNRGDNMYIKVSKDAPVKMFVNDFDNNGIIEQIFTRYIEGKDKPIALKRELAAQLPSLLTNNLTFAEYAKKSIYELIPENILKNSILRKVTISESIVAYNQGQNQFKTEALPQEIQFTSVNTILTTDLNDDHYTDIILGENNFNFKPQFGRLDAGFAHLIPGSKSGLMKPEPVGITNQGEVKSIKEISIKNQKYLILGINDEKPKLFKVKK